MELQFRQYRVILPSTPASLVTCRGPRVCERIARCAGPAVHTENHLRSSEICGLGVTRPLQITHALDFRKTTLYCLNCRY